MTAVRFFAAMLLVLFVSCREDTQKSTDLPKLQEHKLNFFDKRKYLWQQTRLSGILPKLSKSFPESKDEVLKIAGVLHAVLKKDALFADKIILKNPEGYLFQSDETCCLTLGEEIDHYLCARTVKIDKPHQYNMDGISSLQNGAISFHMVISENSEHAMFSLFSMIIFQNSLPIADKFHLYKVDQGPGDICLLEVINDSKHSRWGSVTSLTDRKVFFIRGNVAVYLESTYKHIGCWDLACKIDAALVEQMKKKEREKPPEQKAGNDEKNNGKTE